MADLDGQFSNELPEVLYDYIPPQGVRSQHQPINRKIPDICYDVRTEYRTEFPAIPPPLEPDLPWKPNSILRKESTAGGAIPGFFGKKYADPYSLLTRPGAGPAAAYESSGAARERAVIAEDLSRQRAHDRAIPDPPIIVATAAMENYTTYRSTFCKSIEENGTILPDIRPMVATLHKYYHNADKFSYNSQHNNNAY